MQSPAFAQHRFARSGWAALCLAAALCIAGALGAGRAADFTWTQDDWSGGQYESASGIDPEIHPGLLVLENRIDDFRYLATPSPHQGLWSLEAYHDTLFITAGAYPYGLAGADVVVYDYLTNSFEVVYSPREYGLHLIKEFDDVLYLPGPEPRDVTLEAGSIYSYDGEQWREHDEMTRAIHVNDVEVAHGRLYVSTGQHSGFMDGHGCVWVSDDWGETFSVAFSIAPTPEDMWRRFFGLGHIGDRLFAQPDGFAPETNMIFTTTDGVTWDTTSVNNIPVEKQSVFVPWGEDSLLMACDYRLYIWTGTQWRSRTMPFNLSRWGRGMHVYEGELYGGGQSCEVHRWLGDSQWELVTTLPVDSEDQSIGSLETYYGRVFLSTWGVFGSIGQLLVTAAEPLGTLVSLVHDFGGRTTHGVLSWDDFRPGEGDLAAFQVRSAVTYEELADRPFLGPDGTSETYFEESGTPLSGHHQGRRYFQYRAELRCPDELWMPLLRSVTLEVDSLDAGSVEDFPPGDGHAGGGDAVSFPRLSLASPLPNPASSTVLLGAEVLFAASPAGGCDRQGQALHLDVTDLQGRRLRSVVIPLDETARVRWRWDLRDGRGRRAPAGIYQVTVSLPGSGAAPTARSIVIVP